MSDHCANDLPIGDSELQSPGHEPLCPTCKRELPTGMWIHDECLDEVCAAFAGEMYGVLKNLINPNNAGGWDQLLPAVHLVRRIEKAAEGKS